AVYELRNRALGVRSSTARPVSEGAYQASMELLELSLRYAQAKGARVIVYLSPIRPIQPNPNLPAQLARFQKDIPDVCRKLNIKWLDFTDLVPEELWTVYPAGFNMPGSQPDFAHFTGPAHKQVAQSLIDRAGSDLLAWAGQAKPE